MPIKRNNNDDFMSREMDERLRELEASISTIYAGATEEATARLNNYLQLFEERDREEYARMVEGEITEAEYTAWRERYILRREAYEATVADLTDMLVNADIAAIALVNDDLPYVIAQSFNFTQYVGHMIADREQIPNVSFQIYNAQSVQALIRDNPDLLPAVNIPEDERWNRTHINREITQSIIGGDSIPRVAARLARVTHMDNNSAVRAARTSMTAAENLGRNESYNRIRSQGIGMVKRWSATYDARTRATHRLLDNTTANEQGKFGEGILDALGEPLMEYPADPAGAAAERYNCRCRLNVVPPNYSRDVTVREYEQWLRNNYPEDYAALSDSKYFDRLRPTEEWRTQAQQEFERMVEKYNSNKFDVVTNDRTNMPAYINEMASRGYVGLSGEQSDRFIEEHHNRQIIGHRGANTMDGATSSRINEALRAGNMPSDAADRRLVERLDAAINRNKLPMDMTLFRGVPFTAFESTGVFDGLVRTAQSINMSDFHLPNGRIDFDAWGMAFDAAKKADNANILERARDLVGTVIQDDGFMQVSASSQRNIFNFADVNLQIRAPQGTPAYISSYTEESEIILGRGTQFRIVGVEISEVTANNGARMEVLQIIAELVRR